VPHDALLIDTARLRLVAAQLAHLRTELADPAQLAPLLGAEVPPGWPPGEYDREAIAFFLSQYEIHGPAAVGWYGWYAIRRVEAEHPAELVGAGGYFGPPNAEGTVEVGYSIVDEARDHGYGTELALALAQHALRQPGVRRVIAHVAADNVASQRVLEHAGFRFTGAGASDKRRYEFAAISR
jgi:RimJ/RimL family protein N-acetyltransferase